MDTVSRNWRRSTTFPRTIRCWLCVVPTARSQSYQLGVVIAPQTAYGYDMTCLNAQWSRLCAVPWCQYLKCWCTFPNRAVVDAKPFKSYIAFTHLFRMKSLYLHLEGARETHCASHTHATCPHTFLFTNKTCFANVLQFGNIHNMVYIEKQARNDQILFYKCKTYL